MLLGCWGRWRRGRFDGVMTLMLEVAEEGGLREGSV